MEPILEPAPWLMGERIGLRAPLLDDAAVADRWYIGEDAGDEGAVRRGLQKRESIPWGGNPVITLVIIDLASREIAGGVMATRSGNRTCRLEVRVPGSPVDRAVTLREALALVVPWLLHEVGLMTVVLDTPADDEALVRAAEAAGMVEAVRRREHVVRPRGRVDLLQLEGVNMEWGRHAG